MFMSVSLNSKYFPELGQLLIVLRWTGLDWLYMRVVFHKVSILFSFLLSLLSFCLSLHILSSMPIIPNTGWEEEETDVCSNSGAFTSLLICLLKWVRGLRGKILYPGSIISMPESDTQRSFSEEPLELEGFFTSFSFFCFYRFRGFDFFNEFMLNLIN